MRTLALAIFMLLPLGCASVLSQDALVVRYTETALVKGVVSSMPRADENAEPPVVVNWWYAGSDPRFHHIIYRELRWDASGDPVGVEERYRLDQTSVTMTTRFEKTSDASRWLPLYEAMPGVVPPPADLKTRRHVDGRVPLDERRVPLREPDPSVQPGPLPPGLPGVAE